MTSTIEATMDVVSYLGAAGYPRTVKVRTVEWDAVSWEMKKWLWEQGTVPDYGDPVDGRMFQASVFMPEETEADWDFHRGQLALTALEAVIEATPWHWIGDAVIEVGNDLFYQAMSERSRRVLEAAAARKREDEARTAEAQAQYEQRQEARRRVTEARGKVIASPGVIKVAGAGGEFYPEDGRIILWKKGRDETGFTLRYMCSNWQITHAATGLSIGPAWPTLDEAAGVAGEVANMFGDWQHVRGAADVPAGVRQQMKELFEVLV